jgi:hypothetical protein
LYRALMLGGVASFTMRRQSHPRDPPQGCAEFQRTMAKKCLRTRLSSVCTLRHHTAGSTLISLDGKANSGFPLVG